LSDAKNQKNQGLKGALSDTFSVSGVILIFGYFVVLELMNLTGAKGNLARGRFGNKERTCVPQLEQVSGCTAVFLLFKMTYEVFRGSVLRFLCLVIEGCLLVYRRSVAISGAFSCVLAASSVFG